MTNSQILEEIKKVLRGDSSEKKLGKLTSELLMNLSNEVDEEKKALRPKISKEMFEQFVMVQKSEAKEGRNFMMMSMHDIQRKMGYRVSPDQLSEMMKNYVEYEIKFGINK